MSNIKRVCIYYKKDRRVEVRFDNEYQCLLFIEGSLHNNSTYYTSDREDALLTAKEMIK